MSDNFENKDNQTPVEPEIQSTEPVEAQNQEPAAPQNDPAAPVNGAYHYRTYDLQQRAGQTEQKEEPQATFGSGDWQWQPAQNEEEKPKRKKHKIKWGKIALSFVGVVLAAAICFSAGYAGVLVANQKNTVIIQQVAPSGNSNSAPQLPSAEGVLTSAQVAAKVESSVVAITTEHMTTSNYWFGNGSGVIISEDGYILTCAHVIDGASKITVELRNGETAVAQLVGSYTNGDIAVIKIDKTGLLAAEIADSDQILQGETCYAVGNPEGRFSGSISDDIISALDRTINVSVKESNKNNRGNSLYDMFYGGGYTTTRTIQLNVLQMTAAVSPGNSGGALFNDRGQLIGIVSAKSAATDSEGLGFAIPSNTAMEIASQLIATGVYVPQGTGDKAPSNENGVTQTTNKAVLGITVQTLDPQTAYQHNMMPGVYVSEITIQSTKDAGLQVGDRILSVDEVAVSIATDVTGYLADKNPGDTVNLTVAREGKMLTLTIPLVANTPAE